MWEARVWFVGTNFALSLSSLSLSSYKETTPITKEKDLNFTFDFYQSDGTIPWC